MRPDEDRDDYYYDDEDDDSREIDYGEDEDINDDEEEDVSPITEMDLFGDLNDMSEEDVVGDACCRPRVDRENDEDRSRVDVDFSLLEGDELLLPYSYIVSNREQWKYVLDACESGFRSVKDLDKVSDKILALVADMAALVLEKGNGTNTNERFIQYAEQRRV
jgi:hypothetical protein